MNKLQSQNDVENLEYPVGLGGLVKSGEHYMLIDSYESANALEKVKGKPKSSIALYIPPNALKTTISANFEGLSGGVLVAKLGSQMGLGGAEGGTDQSFLGTVGDLITKTFAKADVAKNFMAAGSGLAVNNHMALVYRGPSEFRKHDFVFQFFPKSNQESNVMRRIINDFKNGMTPRLVSLAGGNNQRLTAPFFKSPRQYDISFYTGRTKNIYLPQIGTSVLMSMTVNHDPQGIVGFHSDGAPVQTTLSLNFQEIEYLLSGDSAEAAGTYTASTGGTGMEATSTQIQMETRS